MAPGEAQAVQAPEPRAPGDTAQDPALPPDRRMPGGHRATRTLLLRVGLSCADQCPRRQSIQAPGSGGVVVSAGADSTAGELAALTVVVPPGVTLYLGLRSAAREQGPHRINSPH